MTATDMAAELCRRFEGLRLKPYLCPAGVATIGYGATRYLDGRKVRLSDPPIARETAERVLREQLDRTYVPGARELCPGAKTEAAVAAVADFAFNLGLARLMRSAFRRKLNAGDLDGAIVELKKWVRGGGRVLPGLVLRREAEAQLLKGNESGK